VKRNRHRPAVARLVVALAIAATAVAGCSLLPLPRQPVEDRLGRELSDHQATWMRLGASDYAFTLTYSCFCPRQGPLRITVHGDAVMSITRDGVEVVPDNLPFVPATIPALFNHVRSSLDADAIEIAYDGATGIPVRVAVDPVRNAVDEEWSVTIEAFELLDPLP
jgi:Family of unknown function (DUF6174)